MDFVFLKNSKLEKILKYIDKRNDDLYLPISKYIEYLPTINNLLKRILLTPENINILKEFGEHNPNVIVNVMFIEEQNPEINLDSILTSFPHIKKLTYFSISQRKNTGFYNMEKIYPLVEELHLYYVQFKYPILSFLSNFPNLKKLTLHETNINNLVDLPLMNKLKYFIYSNKVCRDINIIAKNMPYLEYLRIFLPGLLDIINYLPPNLQVLIAPFTPIDNFNFINHLKNLSHLDITGNNRYRDQLNNVQMISIETLFFEGCNITNLDHLLYMPKLKSLKLTCTTKIENFTFPPQIENLSFSRWFITMDTYFPRIYNLRANLNKLKKLRFENHLTSQVIWLDRFYNLTELNCSINAITTGYFSMIRFPYLRVLNISDHKSEQIFIEPPIEELYMVQNYYRSFPHDIIIKQPLNLKVLHISFNNSFLTYNRYYTFLSQFTCLKTLKIVDCIIPEIYFLNNLPNLEELILENVHISDYQPNSNTVISDVALFDHFKLKIFKFKNKDLESVPMNFNFIKKFVNLEELYIFNKITMTINIPKSVNIWYFTLDNNTFFEEKYIKLVNDNKERYEKYNNALSEIKNFNNIEDF